MTRQEKLLRKWKSMSRETTLLRFFGILFFVVICRLFYLQVVEGSYYKEILAGQHLTASRLQAERGQIFVTDKGGTQLQMTENVEYYNLFIDPKFVSNQEQKDKIIEILTPITYQHLCVEHGIERPDEIQCLENLEEFLSQDILPDEDNFYTFSGDTLMFVDTEDYEESLQGILEEMSEDRAQRLIKNRYQQLIEGGIKERNYLTPIEDEELKNILTQPPYERYTDLISNQYLYILPKTIQQPTVRTSELGKLLRTYGIEIDDGKIRASMRPQEIRYIKLLSSLNAKLTKRIKDAKTETSDETYEGIPLMHGIGLETFQERYYPHGSFMSHLLGYVDQNDEAFYGIEEYYDKKLAGIDGEIIGLATPWIGQIGANNFEIKQPEDGVDIYLTIDPVIQKEVESTIEWYTNAFQSDSIAVTILDPETGKIKAMANAPTFNPNEYQEAFQLRPLEYDERQIVEDLTYIDIPIYKFSGDTLVRTIVDERNTEGRKYIFDNYLGPQVFVDKNISFPYEPGSIAKALTLSIGIDSDAINLYDYYEDDEGSVEVGQYTIANIEDKCTGEHTFKFALAYSCNVGMVRIAQAMTKYVFYTYMNKLGFGQDTTIELANAEPGTLPDFNSTSKARFFNNTYGQGFLTTPLHMASAYAALVNGGYYIKPTVVEAIFNPNTSNYVPIKKKEKTRVFKEETSEFAKEALRGVIESGTLQKYQKEGMSLGGKTGTSEIAFRGKYQEGAGWTNGSFIGVVTTENPNYVIAIQVRRPRTSPWGSDTAGQIFSNLADFLIAYDTIEE